MIGVMIGPDYIVEIDGLAIPSPSLQHGGSRDHAEAMHRFRGRPWLAVHWRCCHAYSRIYRNRAASAYSGTCPGCGRPAKVNIGTDGTNSRFFQAG